MLDASNEGGSNVLPFYLWLLITFIQNNLVKTNIQSNFTA